MENIRLGKYRHFKGNEYELIAIAKNSENPEELLAVYRSVKSPEEVWVRPLTMWCESVTLPDGKVCKRFSPID